MSMSLIIFAASSAISSNMSGHVTGSPLYETSPTIIESSQGSSELDEPLVLSAIDSSNIVRAFAKKGDFFLDTVSGAREFNYLDIILCKGSSVRHAPVAYECELAQDHWELISIGVSKLHGQSEPQLLFAALPVKPELPEGDPNILTKIFYTNNERTNFFKCTKDISSYECEFSQLSP